MIDTVARFIGDSMSESLIDEIAEQCTFESMSANKAANHSWKKDGRNKGEPPFMRKGVVGDWRNLFTVEQNADFDTFYAERMKDSGLKFDFD